MHPNSIFEGRGVVKGVALGRAMVSKSPISFLGDVDIRTGEVTGRSSDLFGRVLKGRILVVPATRGSAGAWRFLYQLKRHCSNPLAIVVDELPDPSVVQGAIMAGIPIVAGLAKRNSGTISDGSLLSVNGTAGTVIMLEPQDGYLTVSSDDSV